MRSAPKVVLLVCSGTPWGYILRCQMTAGPQPEMVMEFDNVMRAIDEFVQTKGWQHPSSERPQTPRNLAVSISIEAAELLECFQWSDEAAREHIENELADVLIYSLRLAQVTAIDPLEAIRKKLEKNLQRNWSKRLEE